VEGSLRGQPDLRDPFPVEGALGTKGRAFEVWCYGPSPTHGSDRMGRAEFMKTKPTPTEATLMRLLREAVAWDESLERDTPEEDLVVPDWREEARSVDEAPSRA
jgi:hypothetical protein